MNRFKNILIVVAAVLFISPLIPRTAQAQWGLGASYEIRDEEPKNGFGVRIEKGILNILPVVDLGIRAHFSNFSGENQIDYQNQTFSYSYTREIQDYDYGVTALGGVNAGFVKPYVGAGLGSNTVNIRRSDIPQGMPLDQEDSESKIYWNALIGIEVGTLPLLKPFVEYRYTDVGKGFFQDIEEQGVPQPSSSNGRVILGVLLRF